MKFTVEELRGSINIKWNQFASRIGYGNSIHLEYRGTDLFRVTKNKEVIYEGSDDELAINIYNENQWN